MLPGEFLDLLGELRVSLGLEVVLQRERNLRQVWDGDRDTALAATLIFLAEADSVDSPSLADPFNPARLGWVMTDVPRIEEDQLFEIQVGAHGDWFDTATNTVHKNPEALKRLAKIWKIWARRLRFSMLVRNVVTGAEASYPRIGYSAGAAEWWKNGGRLRHEGVDNLEFSLPRATGE